MEEVKRKLVSIRRVADVQPIKDADRIEVITVDGWGLVAVKGEFKPGDICVYFEIDSFLPIEERYEFLRKSSYKKIMDTGSEGFRIKTMSRR
jgi:RNA ligase (TIGR02306 family)